MAYDGANCTDARARLYDAHRARLRTLERITINAAGPLFAAAESSGSPCGSLFIVTAADVDDVWAFVQADPFYFGHVWESINVRKFTPLRWQAS